MAEERKRNNGLVLAEKEGREAKLVGKPRVCPYTETNGSDAETAHLFRDVRSLKRRVREWFKAYDAV